MNPDEFCNYCKIRDMLSVDDVENVGVEVLIVTFVEAPNIQSSQHMRDVCREMGLKAVDTMKIFTAFQRVVRENVQKIVR
jgi:hypothetical protein